MNLFKKQLFTLSDDKNPQMVQPQVLVLKALKQDCIHTTNNSGQECMCGHFFL